MTDSKLVTGVLIAACVCLLVANAMTWAGISGYSTSEKAAANLGLPAPIRTAPAVEAAPAQLGTAPEEGAVPE